jgi:hypothetical protein
MNSRWNAVDLFTCAGPIWVKVINIITKHY